MRTTILSLGAIVAILSLLMIHREGMLTFKSGSASRVMPAQTSEDEVCQNTEVPYSQVDLELLLKGALVDMEARLRAIDEPAERETLLSEFLNRWPDSACPDLMRWIQSLPDEALQSQAAHCLLPHILQGNPRLAAEFATTLSNEGTRCDLLNRVIDIWDSTNWPDAFTWLEHVPDGEMKNEALLHLGYHWQKVNPQSALDYLKGVTNNESLIAALTSQWAISDPLAAASWAVQLPNGGNRDKAISGLVAVWAQKSPVEAANFIISLPAGEARDQGVISVVSAWSNIDPGTVAQWVDRFPESDVKAEAAEQLLTIWAGKNWAQAGDWLREKLAGSLDHTYDGAVKDYSQLIFSTSPSTAFSWAEEIRDNNLREDQMETVARKWMICDPTAAKQAIIYSSVSERFKSQFLNN